MVAVELINYTFFIVGHFEWRFVKLFSYGAFLGVVITLSFRSVLKKTSVFEWRPRNIWGLAFLSTLTMSVLMNLLFYLPSILQEPDSAAQMFSFIGLLGGTINWMRYVGVWVILYFMYHILERARKTEEAKLKSENIARVTELELLKTQLNPHFLFNALNSIKALVSVDPDLCKDAIVKLSELLRFTLHYDHQALIPVHDEIEEVKKYFSLEQIRFGSRVHVAFEVDETALNRLIPPAMLLTLAENAIKHGVAKQSGECHLRLIAQTSSNQLELVMTNPGSLQPVDSSGIGLKNIRRRLYHFFGDRASFNISEREGIISAKIEIVAI